MADDAGAGLGMSWHAEFGDAFQGRSALVTGASGFLGSHLCDALLALGVRTFGLARTTPSIGNALYTHLSVDITDRDAVKAAILKTRPDYIYHLAASASAVEDRALVMPMLHTNLCGTVHVLLAAAETGCDRVVLTCSAEEARGQNLEAAVASPYGAAKTAASVYGRLFHRVYGVPVALVRPILAYGPRQHRSKLIPYVIRCLLRNDAPLLSSGERLCDFVYVNDVVRGFLMAATSAQALGETIELGSGRAVRIRDVVETLVTLTGTAARPSFGAQRERTEDHMGSADAETARRLLGWHPRWSLEAGLMETIAWYKHEEQTAQPALPQR
jgi:nucleoside-diphosphate-sugar epimerase